MAKLAATKRAHLLRQKGTLEPLVGVSDLDDDVLVRRLAALTALKGQGALQHA